MNKKTKLAVIIGVVILVAAGIFIIGGLRLRKDNGVIQMASKPMTEQYILTEVLKLLIEKDTDLSVDITKGVGGGTTNIHPAMLAGDFDIYPEYTGTAWVTVLKQSQIPDEETLLANVKEEYRKLGLYFSDLYGFNNSYALAIKKEVADQYRLETYSDLAAVSDQLVFGGNYDYIEREDGYPLLCSTYGMKFKKTVDMDIALKYKAMEQGEMDVTNAFTTDAMLSVADVKILKDDLQFFTTYYCGTVVRQEILDQYPQLKPVLEKMTGLISDEDMRRMNYEVEVNERNEEDVAVEFLTAKGLL